MSPLNIACFIALFGISVMDGIIILSQFNQLIDAGVERTAAILRRPSHACNPFTA
jgi:Cu/Ag efflux pump CusA